MRINVLLVMAGFFILLALPAFSNAQAPGQGVPVRLELKPFPPPADGVVRCKSGDELQIQLVGYDSSKSETTLNQWRPNASSSNANVATAEVPAHTGHQVRVKCLADGQTTITAAYNQVSTSLTLQVGSGAQTTTIPSPSPSPSALPSASPTPQPSPSQSPQPTKGFSGYESVLRETAFADNTFGSNFKVICPTGKRVIGGGAAILTKSTATTTGYGFGNGFYLSSSLPFDPIDEFGEPGSGWNAVAAPRPGYTPNGTTYVLRVTVICAFTQ